MTALAAEPPSTGLDEFTGAAREGTLRWRDETVRLLRSRGVPAGRPLQPASGAWSDRGQIEGVPGWLLIARRQKTLKLNQGLDAAAELASEAGARFHAVVAFRRNRPTGAAYVCLSLDQFADLIASTQTEGAQP